MTPKPAGAFLDFGTMGPDVDTAPLEALLDLRCYTTTNADEVAERLAGCRIAIVNKTTITREHIAAAAALELIVLAATGTDNVDLAAAGARGVAVANIRDYCSPAVAQHVFALVLTLNQGIVGYDQLAKSGEWSRSKSFAMFDFPIRELAGRKLGIVGYGSLGQAVARVGRSLGMQVLVSTRPGDSGPCPPDRVPLGEVIESVDVLSLHCPLNEATRHMLSTEQFRRMQRHAIVINTARGALIDQQALADALRAGEIAGAGIDVLPSEPPPADEPLLAPGIPNLLLTPHIAWASIESRQRGLAQVAQNIDSFLSGGRLRRVE
jgi:glycerate dehydrogenase